MTSTLSISLERRYRQGPTIRASLLVGLTPPRVTALFGPSGGGKTTLLRCLAGLERPDTGRVVYGSEVWCDVAQRIHVPPHARRVGYLFQDHALFPHLTVRQNIAYGASPHDSHVDVWLQRFNLAALANRYPHQLSGGQQQRVALVRTLATRPRLLLLDEPLSALDTLTREAMRDELRRVLAQCECPTLMVTHERSDVLALAHEIVIVAEGTLLQSGSVAEVFSRPTSSAVARLVGIETVEVARVVACEQGLTTLQIGMARLLAVTEATVGSDVTMLIRGEDVTLTRELSDGSSARNHLQGRVLDVIPEGPLVRVIVECGFRLTALITRAALVEMGLQPGQAVVAAIKAPAIQVLPAPTPSTVCNDRR